MTTRYPPGRCPAQGDGVGVSAVELPSLPAGAKIVNIQRGETFIFEGDPAVHIYIVIAGNAKLYKMLPDGRRQIIGFGQAATLLGLTSGMKYNFTAEAIDHIQLCRIPWEQVQSVLGEFTAMGLRLLDIAIADLGRAQDHALLLGRKTATEKVATFLLFQLARAQSPRAWPTQCRLAMSRVDIADYLGTAHETITRALARLRRTGVIAVRDSHNIIIYNHGRLEAISNGFSEEPCAGRRDFTYHPAISLTNPVAAG